MNKAACLRAGATVAALVATALVATSAVPADSGTFTVFTPEQVPWRVLRETPRLEYSAIQADPAMSGPFTFRVRAVAPHVLPPHTHPDERTITVISGTYWAGVGPTYDPAALIAFPAGSFYVMPAGLPHFSAVLEGEVVFQESGIGPSRNDPVEAQR